MSLASEESLIRALQSSAPSANILALTVIAKASASPSSSAILSSMKGLVGQFIRTWLSSPSVEVGEKATRTLGDILEVDCEHKVTNGLDTHMSGLEIASRTVLGQGFMWRRLFHDQEQYASIFSLCDLSTIGAAPDKLDQRQKSLAQARLLRIMPRLAALDFTAVSKPHLPGVEKQFSMPDSTEGLLWYVGLEMVDIEDDVLMHFTLIDFFAELLQSLSTVDLSAVSMDYLKRLMKTVMENDESMYKSLESLGQAESSSPELVDLMTRLSQ